MRCCIVCGVGPIGVRKNARFCPACAKAREAEQRKQWREKNRGRVRELDLASKKRRFLKDPEKVRASRRKAARKWYYKNLDKARADIAGSKRLRYSKDPERHRRSRRYWYKAQDRAFLREKERAYRKKNPEYGFAKNARRRARMHGADTGTITPESWAERQRLFAGCCAYCPEPATEMDHVLSFDNGGLHDILNVVPACRSCNASKGDLLPLEWAKR